MTLLPVSCARADTYVQESGDARVLSHRPTPSHADLVDPSPVRLDRVEPTTLCGNLNISLIWPSNARYSEPFSISREIMAETRDVEIPTSTGADRQPGMALLQGLIEDAAIKNHGPVTLRRFRRVWSG